jgi:hypothetical protein
VHTVNGTACAVPRYGWFCVWYVFLFVSLILIGN